MKFFSVILLLCVTFGSTGLSESRSVLINTAWTVVSGRLKQLDLSPSDRLWGVSTADNIYTRFGNSWKWIFGKLKHVSVGDAGVWGVTSADNIYFRNGVTSVDPAGSNWTSILGKLKQIDSGPAGIVYGVTSNNYIFCRLGITAANPKGRGWRHVPGRLKYISCGPLGCWGVSAANFIYFRNGVTAENCVGTSWRGLHGRLKQVEVGGDGALYGVTSSNYLWTREGITPNKPMGTHWRFIPSLRPKHVSVGTSKIFGVDQNNRIFHFTGLEFSHKRYAIILTDKFPMGGIGKILVRNQLAGVVYDLTKPNQDVKIDSISGQLTLLRHADQAYRATIRFAISAKLGNDEVTAAVTIYVIPLYHGDELALPAMRAVRKGLKSNHVISLSYGPTAEITPELLDRSLKSVSASDPVSATSEAEIKVERAIDLVKSIIIRAYEKDYGIGAVLGFFKQRELFSNCLATKLARESSCHDAVESIKCDETAKYRRSDGRCSNLKFPTAGAAGAPYVRLVRAKYFDVDGINDPIGFPNQPDAPDIPSPFKISKDFIKDEIASSAAPNLTPAVMQFGQFLDHDLDLSAGGEDRSACTSISCDGSDADYTPPCYPILPLKNNQPPCVRFVRSTAVCHQEGFPTEREQLNDITGVIDGNNIYGSSETVTRGLRNLQNDVGLMRVSRMNGKEFLPLDPNSGVPCIAGCFKAGDIRANEQQGLTSFHTLFLREHNRIARRLKSLNKNWNGEKIFQETRKIVGAVLQKIVYEDYLPIILGPNALPAYKGYNENVNPSISNAFAAAAYRFGHSTIRSKFDLLNNNYDPIVPAINLRFLFFNNTITKTLGIEPVLFGLIGNVSEQVDNRLSPEIIEHLFEQGNVEGENLAALNIQRSRDHGLPGYNKFREFCGLKCARTFEDTKNEIQDQNNRDILKNLYNDDPNLTELWVAGLAEVPVPGATVGPTLRCVIREQFLRSRDGDRFYYENPGIFTPQQVHQIKKHSLSKIYCNNAVGIVSIQMDAFKSAVNEVRPSCDEIPGMSLCPWKECSNGKPLYNERSKNCECTQQLIN